MKTAIAILAVAVSTIAFPHAPVSTKNTRLSEFATNVVSGDEGPDPIFSGSKNAETDTVRSYVLLVDDYPLLIRFMSTYLYSFYFII